MTIPNRNFKRELQRVISKVRRPNYSFKLVFIWKFTISFDSLMQVGYFSWPIPEGE